MESNKEDVFNLLDLVQMYREDKLPPNKKVFKYVVGDGKISYIHIDELKRESSLVSTFGKQYEDRLLGIKKKK